MVVALIGASAPAFAEVGSDDLERVEPVRFSLGVKGYGGGNYLTAATLVPNTLGSLPFSDGAGGWAGGGGLYLQARLLNPPKSQRGQPVFPIPSIAGRPAAKTPRQA